jgi:YidC/Oxa1 family membrane protein insertase
MDRNSLLGLLLIGLILIGAVYLNQPDKETLEKMRNEFVADSLKKVKSEAKKSSANRFVDQKVDSSSINIDSISEISKNLQLKDFSNTSSLQDSVIILENELLKAKINLKGASINYVELKKFKTWDKKPVILFTSDTAVLNFVLPLKNGNVNSSEINFSMFSFAKNLLVLEAKTNDNNSIKIKYQLTNNSYLIKSSVELNGIDLIYNKEADKIKFNWAISANRQEKNIENERNNTTICYNYTNDGDTDIDKINPLANEKLVIEGTSKWIAFKQQFFSAGLITENNINANANIETKISESDKNTKDLSANFDIPFNQAKDKSINISFYFGPNDFSTLKTVGNDFQKIIPLGWGIFGAVNKFIVIPVFKFLDDYNLNYGIVILLLTLVIKLLLFPFQYRSYLSQAKMRVLKPELDELNKQYENEDAVKKQQAVMSLYKQAGVNPLGGCVPLLFQIPILFALFNFFPNAIELRQQSFLWAEDLSTYDSVLTLPFEIPFYGTHVSLFALLMTISTIIYTRMNNQLSGTNAQMPQLKWMMYLMPVIFLFVLNSYASGLNYYYFLANIITFGQQFAFQKLVDDKKIHAQIQLNKLNPKATKVSGFQQKLEEMAKKRGIQPPGK